MQQTTNHNLIWTFSQGTTQGNMYVWKPSYKISFWGHNAAYNSWSSARFHNTKYNPLTFKGLMLDISNAACTPQWPNVIYIQHRACIKFFSTHDLCLSRKHKQTCCGSHNKTWYSSGAMMSFMAVRVSTLFMCTLDLWGSAEGVKGTTQ